MKRAWGHVLALLLGVGVTAITAGAARGQGLFFVDDTATGANNGLTWADAFTDLQSALEAARQSDFPSVELWVAEGTYYPASPMGDRSASFELAGGVGVFGGFAGAETRRTQRNPVLHPTILSGDLNQDDAAPSSGSTCCTSHASAGCDDEACEAAVCAEDAFCCNERWDQTCAALTQCLCGSLCTNQCDNSFHVVTATGVDASAILDGVIVMGGFAHDGVAEHQNGAGLLVRSGSPTIAGVVFLGNSAEAAGGAVYSEGGPFLASCSFLGNRAARGGGLYNSLGSVEVVNGIFVGNEARSGGGAITNAGGTLHLINGTVTENRGSPAGGIRGIGASQTRVSNSILWRNESAGAFDERAQISTEAGSTLDISFSCVQGLSGLLGGGGNIGADPKLADPAGTDAIAGTLDDNVRLTAESPCIDAGRNADLPPDKANLDQDLDFTEVTPVDRDGLARFFDDPRVPNTGEGDPPVVDIGAYEVAGDCNGNGVFDDEDVADETSPDCNGNRIPDECEIRADSPAPGGPFFCTFDCNRDCDVNGIPDDCQADSDADGVIDLCDECPDTATGLPVDLDGCEIPGACCFRPQMVCFNELLSGECATIGGSFLGHGLTCASDPDGDGTAGCADQCPTDPEKVVPGVCGCGVPDTDGDGDGLADCIDPCPSDDPNDTDGDGVCDSNDPCPMDNPDDTDGDGMCDSDDPCPMDNPDDTDGDGVCDSDELCPNDPNKTEPGICGCGVPDADSDLDGVFDCFDQCLNTPPDTPVDEAGCPAQGACCFRAGGEVVCADNTVPLDCMLVGGAYQGNLTTCDAGCLFAGDFNGDGDIDLDDAASFAACLAGPDVMTSPDCERADFNDDGKVDLRDVAGLLADFTGPRE